jgi:arginase
LAVKINRQMNGVALLGVPTSAASLAVGHERGPAAWRAAGLVERLREAGLTVTDHGDCAERNFAADDDHPRARNAKQVVAVLEELRPKVELAVKSGALPIVLGGDDSIVLAVIAACRRYYKTVGLIYMDRDGGLNEPATTPSGCIDGMVISHVIGRGSPEIVRFWGEPPLVREPEIALFGIDRLDEPEERFLSRSLLRHYSASDVNIKGASNIASEALERVHGIRHEFVVHVDLDVINKDDFPATNLSEPGGLLWQDFAEALGVFVRQPMLAALSLAAYNPTLDPHQTAAKKMIDLLAQTLARRVPGAAASEAVQANAPKHETEMVVNAAPIAAESSEKTENVTASEQTSAAEPGKIDTAGN